MSSRRCTLSYVWRTWLCIAPCLARWERPRTPTTTVPTTRKKCRRAEHHASAAGSGDVRAVDRAAAEPVDVLTAGFPGTDISNAGKRAGITGAQSNLWRCVVDAVRALRIWSDVSCGFDGSWPNHWGTHRVMDTMCLPR
ncbi:DNA cytosine methyltransferase [Planosporangium sp. 12N6]|uniref:DNA cytosine methyltransferase n=1 Tax=Planosporangium spinosum TaxID=3402278 RepID=UPI003CF6BE9C